MVGFFIKKWFKERSSDYKRQKEQIINAWDLFDERKHREVERLTSAILQEKDIPDDIYASCLVLQSEVLNRTATDFKKSYELAKEANQLAEKNKDPMLLLGTYIALISSLLDQGSDQTINELFLKINALFEKVPGDEKETQYIKARYYRTKGLYYGHLGKIDLSLECYLTCAEIEEKIGKIYDFIASSNNIGLCYAIKGDVQKSIDYLLNIIKVIRQKGEESRYQYILATTYGNLGTQFSEQGELDKGLEYLQKSLNLSIATSNVDSESITLANMGDTFVRMGDYDKAINFYQQSLDLFTKSGNQIFEISLLVALLSTYISMNDEANIQNCYDKISLKCKAHPNDEFFTVNYLFSKALLLKQSSRLADHVEAQKLFKEINNKTEYYTNVTKESILYYVELLIEELKFSLNDSLLSEIIQANKKLMTLAKNQGSYNLLVEAMLLDAKISIINLNFNHARHILMQAQISAEEKGLKHLSQKISNEHDNLLIKMNQWENVVHDDSSYQERIELANFEEILRSMIRKSYKVTEEEQEQGLILLIVNLAGLSIFSRKFELERQVEEQIVASLLTAINSFSQEAFNTKESLERIKLGENIVILKNISEFTVCYAFKGPSYHATKKINALLSKIQTDESLLSELYNLKTFLPESANKKLNAIVDELFAG